MVKRFLVKTLIKKPAAVAKHFGLDDEYLRDSSGCSFAMEIPFRNMRSIYLPYRSVATIAVFEERLCQFFKLFGRDEPVSPHDLFRASNF